MTFIENKYGPLNKKLVLLERYINEDSEMEGLWGFPTLIRRAVMYDDGLSEIRADTRPPPENELVLSLALSGQLLHELFLDR